MRPPIRGVSINFPQQPLSHYWQRINTIVRSKKFLATVTTVTLGATLYAYASPESILIRKARLAFNKSVNYHRKLQVYSSMPEPKLPIFDGDSKKLAQLSVDEWADLVEQGFGYLKNSHLWNLVSEMRESLLLQVNSEFDSLEDRLKELRKILPDSLELYLAIEQQLDAELERSNKIPVSLLKDNVVKSREITALDTKLLKMALLAFRGPVVEFFSLVQGEMDVDEFVDKLEVADKEKVTMTLHKLLAKFEALDVVVRNNILEDIATTLIDNMMKTPELNKTYETMLQQQLIEKLAQDKYLRPGGNLVGAFKTLPARKQARVLLMAFKKYDTSLNFIKSVAASDGIVAIKLCQLLSEEPILPEEYRASFGQFRESNKPMSVQDFYNHIPGSISDDIEYLVERAGVGSVKDVWKVQMKNKQEKICAVVRRGIEEDAVATLKALDNLDVIAGLAGRIRRTVFREMDLWLEYDAFEQLRKTDFGNSDIIVIPKVLTNTLGCLVRDVGEGKTVAKIIDKGTRSEKEEVVPFIQQMHKIAVTTALEKGFIMSDLHFGNMSFKKKLVLFDPGQNDVLTRDQSNALLWTLVTIFDKKNVRKFKSVAINKIAAVVENKNRQHVIDGLDKAFDMCADGDDVKTRFSKFLIATGENKVSLPSGFFATAKMLNVLLSQEELLGLTPNVNKEIEGITKRNFSTRDKVVYMYRLLLF
jgi:predicted unusual protein kinase regulating ubiquinone biosynthesis (AarF/ABC1/UbiB family)